MHTVMYWTKQCERNSDIYVDFYSYSEVNANTGKNYYETFSMQKRKKPKN